MIFTQFRLRENDRAVNMRADVRAHTTVEFPTMSMYSRQRGMGLPYCLYTNQCDANWACARTQNETNALGG